MQKLKNLILNIAIPISVGIISALISNISKNIDTFVLPSFTPPKIAFPIIWSILYVLMGISSYIILNSTCIHKWDAIKIYIVNIFINGLWSIIFFKYKLFLAATLLILLLIILTIVMIYKYYKIDSKAAYLQIPYLIWLVLALVLSYNVYMLN